MSTVSIAAAANQSRRRWRVGAFRQDAEQVFALERVKAWALDSLALGSDDTIFVAEIACGRPDCPPLETVVTFWLAGAERHVFKVFKPVAEVAFDDLPPAWLRESLYASDPVDGMCC